ncbi:MAG: peptidase S41 [Planctomycetes bacterium]|nr:peptidase S41 [Planctomycetota bacterium]
MRRFAAAVVALPFVALLAAPALPGEAGGAAAGEAAWLRYAAISPDGSRIAFEYRGDLWVVPSGGGEARALTTHVAYERSPVWSPDGSKIAFCSDRFGNFDVFVMSSAGGQAERLTFHSANDVPYAFTPDGKDVVFGSTRVDAPQAFVSSTWLGELYAVPVGGGRARMLLTTPAERAQFSRDGSRVLYQDRKGYENEWRKHHRSSVARDVWMWDTRSGEHTKITDFKGEDRNPVWTADGASFWYLSEDGASPTTSSNVWRRSLAADVKPEQVTKHAGGPVRFLSAANDDTLCYAYDGALWTLKPGAEPVRLHVTAPADDRENGVLVEVKKDGATEFAPSPEGDEVAFVVRGDVFVCSTKHGTTRRITATPGMERSLSWAPDGRAIHYSAERNGSWDLVRTVLAKDVEDRFVQATELREENVLATPAEEQQPLVSPDGKLVAFLRDRDTIQVLDLATKQAKTIVPAAREYSYADGDIHYAWSPDSRFLAFTYVARARWASDVGVADVATGTIENVTDSGYEEDVPTWTSDGRALLFSSDRLGRRSHGSWGADGDLFAFQLTRESDARARLSKEDFELLKKAEEKAKKEKDEKSAADAKTPGAPTVPAADPKKDAPPEPVQIEWTMRERRTRRLTSRSSPVGSFVATPDGEVVVYWAQVDETWDLWATRPRTGDEKRVSEFHAGEPGDLAMSKDGKSVFVRGSDGGMARVTLGGTDGTGDLSGSSEPIAYAAELNVDLAKERAAIFDHAWRQARAKFYDPKLHGVDWDLQRREHERFLPHIANGSDFAELLSEMLGELNASHTGSSYRPHREGADATAALGLVFDPAWAGDGLQVAEVLAGGPFDRAVSKITRGAIVTAIDGETLPATMDPARALNRKAGKYVVVTAKSAAGEVVTERVKAIDGGAENGLLYRRWVQRCEDVVEKASGGRVGYVHVAGMNEDSFRVLFKDSLGRHSDCEALLVDTRWNGGGWLHDDLVGFLGAKDYLWFVPRGKELGQLGAEPARRWTRPVAVLINEGDYSDAHVFPYSFKALGLGKLVGTPVAGTGTAVWWEGQVDPSIVFGIPQVGLRTKDGAYLENLELEPDVPVYSNPAELARGDDRQLTEAVKVLLAEADAKRVK